LDVERGGGNGGFPEPPAGEPVRLARAQHSTCGEATRIRLPGTLPARTVRRVVCDSCWQPYECDAERGEVEDLGCHLFAPPRPDGDGALGLGHPRPPTFRLKRPRAPHWLSGPAPDGRAWRIGSVIVAAIAVIVVLSLIQRDGSDEPTGQSASSAPSAIPAPSDQNGGGGRGAKDGPAASPHAQLIDGSNYSLALPAGWERTNPEGGSTFTATAADGTADATLWIQNDPSLDFPKFEARSLAQLTQLAGPAHVVSRQAAPTPEGTVVHLATDNPAGEPSYDVVLRVAGPYRYYLSTTVQPDAPSEAVEGAELIRNSFSPTITGAASGGSSNGGGK